MFCFFHSSSAASSMLASANETRFGGSVSFFLSGGAVFFAASSRFFCQVATASTLSASGFRRASSEAPNFSTSKYASLLLWSIFFSSGGGTSVLPLVSSFLSNHPISASSVPVLLGTIRHCTGTPSSVFSKKVLGGILFPFGEVFFESDIRANGG